MNKIYLLIILSSFFFISCKQKTLFRKLNSEYSGIHFNNRIIENDSMNIIDLENIYNGGGCGLADFNNDGLIDIYFSGNMVSNKLYLNKGNLKFEDITNVSGTEGQGKWSRGISIVDINNDGLQDIYLSETIYTDSIRRENILYINKGLNADGLPIFKDEAKDYGLNDNSHTTQAAFFDYDNDGDLDVYLAVNVFAKRDNPNIFRNKFINGEHPNTDRLYRNDWDSLKGHPIFTNISRSAGILQEGYAHSVTICDINQDGWKDIFVTNDYLSENLLWINNRNGTFGNKSKEYFKHTAYNSMGADVIDINNDGLSDVIELDMNPEDNYRKKTMLGGANYQSYLYNDAYQFQYQYIRNNLHLNLGMGIGSEDTLGHPIFGDISFYSGIAETDWSWTPLLGDFDNDGYRDIIITNGFPKDVTDHDFMSFRNSAFGMNDKSKLLSLIPEVKISNYAYKNKGNLKFENVTKKWGFDIPSFSNGAITADLDNDGDLDVVINNINEEAFIFENKLNDKKNIINNYVQIKLEGKFQNKDAFGSWIKLFYGNGKMQSYETSPVRGYLSSVNSAVHFGLGGYSKIDSIVIIWADNKKQILKDISINQKIIIKESDNAKLYFWEQPLFLQNTLFTEVSESLNLKILDSCKDFNDFNIQRLLPHKLSEIGPALVSGDLNSDGLDDIIIGGNEVNRRLILFQHNNGKFYKSYFWDSVFNQICSDTDLLLFDADNDKDLDLYVCSGGNKSVKGDSSYQDKLYLNNGKGEFILTYDVLPLNTLSKSCVKAFDYDKDGDTDLFLGGRVEPGSYPKSVSSKILRNDSKNGKIKFIDVTNSVAHELSNIGLICDAVCTDYNDDGWVDLVLAGEWMPLTFFINQNGKFVNQTSSAGIGDKFGWWNCIEATDIDNDGKIDFIAGNLGENSFFSNSKYPIYNYYGDFDNSGIAKTITTKYIKDRYGNFHEYPSMSRDEVIEQLPSIKKKFLDYKSFALATFNQIFSSTVIKNSIQKHANYFSNSIIKNLGNGKFKLLPLPPEAQFSSVSSILTGDFNSDGKIDLVLTGNDYGMEVFNGRLDAMNGIVLLGDGKSNFYPLSTEKSGLYVPLSSKSMTKIKYKGIQNLILVSQYRGELKIFKQKKCYSLQFNRLDLN